MYEIAFDLAVNAQMHEHIHQSLDNSRLTLSSFPSHTQR